MVSNDKITDEEPIIKHVILQTARIYSKATGKSTFLAVCSRGSLQVLPVCSINAIFRNIPDRSSSEKIGGTHYACDEGWNYGASVHADEEFLERFGSLIKL